MPLLRFIESKKNLKYRRESSGGRELSGYKEAMHFGDWIGCSKTLFACYVPAMRLVFPALESMLKSLAKPKSGILGFIFESMLKSLAKPKSEILGFIFASSRMFWP